MQHDQVALTFVWTVRENWEEEGPFSNSSRQWLLNQSEHSFNPHLNPKHTSLYFTLVLIFTVVFVCRVQFADYSFFLQLSPTVSYFFLLQMTFSFNYKTKRFWIGNTHTNTTSLVFEKITDNFWDCLTLKSQFAMCLCLFLFVCV